MLAHMLDARSLWGQLMGIDGCVGTRYTPFGARLGEDIVNAYAPGRLQPQLMWMGLVQSRARPTTYNRDDYSTDRFPRGGAHRLETGLLPNTGADDSVGTRSPA